MTGSDALARIERLKVIPVVVIDDVTSASPLARALDAGGLPCAEVTFRTPAAAEAIRVMADTADLALGAGTVLTPAQVDAAVAAGATYIVTPGFSAAVVAHCQDVGIPVFPGVATPAEVQVAYEAGLDTVKFFPAESLGGLPTLKAIAAPFSMMRFIPTGGISADNCSAYLRNPNVVAVGGTWIVKPALIHDGNFTKITDIAAQAVAVAEAATETKAGT